MIIIPEITFVVISFFVSLHKKIKNDYYFNKPPKEKNLVIMKRINIAELLKNCPKGMELDCTMWDNVTFIGIEDIGYINILIKTPCGQIKLSKEGCFSHNCNNAKCVIFPKGKTTWEGFVPPCKFNDGDILVHTQNQRFIMSIYHKGINDIIIKTHCILWDKDEGLSVNMEICCYADNVRLATEEEKQKLFDAIKANGYRWNAETKTLDKLAKPNFENGSWITNGDYTWKVISVDNFDYTLQNQLGEYVEDTIDHVNEAFHLWTIKDAKEGDVLAFNDGIIVIFKDLYNKTTFHSYCHIEDGVFSVSEEDVPDWWNGEGFKPANKKQRKLLSQKMREAECKWNAETKTLEKLHEPIFKVGDKIRHKRHTGKEKIVTEIKDTHYILDDELALPFISQNNYELVPNKFDIITLKPFDKVLVRQDEYSFWLPSIFGFYNEESTRNPFICSNGHAYKYCVPYEKNEHLLGTTDDCNKFYKTWE